MEHARATRFHAAISKAHRLGLDVTRHPSTGNTMIDGLEWNMWMRIGDNESKSLVIKTKTGTPVVKGEPV